MKPQAVAVSIGNQLTEGSRAIKQLDLGPIKVKLMDQDEGEGWSAEQANVVEKWYRRFLLLNLKYPSVSIAPNLAIDTFWHNHILDTHMYVEDCQNIFGKFLHHFPYFGMRGEKDAGDLEKAFSETKDLFLAEFGESLDELDDVFSAQMEKSSICGRVAKCKAGNCRSCKNTVGNDQDSNNLSRPAFTP